MKPPRHVGVKKIQTSELEPNPYNPRRLFDRQPLATLGQSIEKVGILVPLTVYWDDERRKYVILDGQRRWICASQLNLAEVPVNVIAKPTLVQNIVTMFQIHKLREDWELMPTALTFELLMSELQEKRVKPLAELTGLDQAVVVRCKKLLSFPRRYQEMMLEPEPEKRIKADFFIELYAVTNDRHVKTMPWFRRNHFTDQMLARYRAGRLRSVTDFRLIKQHINNAAKAKKVSVISKRLEDFANDSDLPISHLEIAAAAIAKVVRATLRAIDGLEKSLRELDVEQAYGQSMLWSRLNELLALIRQRLAEADRKVR